jgi:hypothetical protein
MNELIARVLDAHGSLVRWSGYGLGGRVLLKI